MDFFARTSVAEDSLFKEMSQRLHTPIWSPDGKHIVSGGVDKTIHIWNAMTGKCLLVYTARTDQVKTSRGRSMASTWLPVT